MGGPRKILPATDGSGAKRGRCGHATFPIEVLPVGGGKKIAHCPECGRSGPACEGSAEAIAGLRETLAHEG